MSSHVGTYLPSPLKRCKKANNTLADDFFMKKIKIKIFIFPHPEVTPTMEIPMESFKIHQNQI